MKAVNYFFDKHSFKKAFKNAETTGVLLAKSLIKFRETHSGPIYLFGHSLGGKISLECTDYMYAFNQHIIDKLILLGTAEYTGERVYNAIEVVGSITNCYNPNDGVLFYGLGIMSKILGIRRFNNPMNVIGIRSIEGFNNIDCSELIKTDNYKMYGHNYSSAIVSIIQSIGI
jgi:pimeloyl-ACP methyl ester carboxylesterase